MDKVIARKLAKKKLQAVLQQSEESIVELLTEPDYEFITVGSVKYQICVEGMWEDKGKIIAVMVTVDDGTFPSTFSPLCDSDSYCLSEEFQEEFEKNAPPPHPPTVLSRLLKLIGIKMERE